MMPWLTLAVHLLAADPAAGGYPNRNLLVEPETLARPEEAKKVRVLDVRGKAKYDDGHVPGAVLALPGPWSAAVGAGKADAAFWKKELAAVGVSPAVPVVVYSDDVRDAARAWWLLKYAGVADVRLLNGGWDAYAAAKGAVSKEPTRAAAAPHDWTPDAARLATKADLLDVLKAGTGRVLDARSKEEFAGAAATARRNGHVPRAAHVEWTEFLDPGTKKFLPAPALAELFRSRNVRLDGGCVTYCQSGGRASVDAFALELMGAKGVRNYYKSWSEWGNAADTPVETRRDRK